jgi:hypothetical protein
MTLPPSSRFTIPAYWTPEQALAVVELLDDLREVIWDHYDMQVIDELRQQHLANSSGPSDTTPPTEP